MKIVCDQQYSKADEIIIPHDFAEYERLTSEVVQRIGIASNLEPGFVRLRLCRVHDCNNFELNDLIYNEFDFSQVNGVTTRRKTVREVVKKFMDK